MALATLRMVPAVATASWPRSAFGSMSHHLGWMRDCRVQTRFLRNLLRSWSAPIQGTLSADSEDWEMKRSGLLRLHHAELVALHVGESCPLEVLVLNATSVVHGVRPAVSRMPAHS